jgi:hypothetical protein
LNVYLAVSHINGVDMRVLTILWHFADRWGRTSPDGIVLPLRLTNAMLGDIVGARRQSVSTAVSDLVRRGLVDRCENGCCWHLRGGPPAPTAPRHSEVLTSGELNVPGELGVPGELRVPPLAAPGRLAPAPA